MAVVRRRADPDVDDEMKKRKATAEVDGWQQ